MKFRHLFIFLFVYLYSLIKKPQKVALDLCNLCQLNCTKCWIRKDEELIRKNCGGFGYVNFETFKKFINKNKFIKEIEISNNGEALLNPDFNKIAEYAFSKKIKLTAFNGVNLNYLTEEMAESLVKYKFKDIVISIDAATPETYEIYRRKGDFNKVIENIKLINKYKEKYNSNFPKLIYKFIVFGHNEHEMMKAKELAQNLNMEILFTKNGFEEYSPIKNYEEVKKIDNNFDICTNLLLTYSKSKRDKNYKIFCESLFFEPVINYNGDLFGCCTLHLNSFKVNVFETGLLKALKTKNYLYAKAMLLDFSVPSQKDIPCSECQYYKQLKDKNCSLFKNIIKKGLF